jgi:hypothetical protein
MVSMMSSRCFAVSLMRRPDLDHLMLTLTA